VITMILVFCVSPAPEMTPEPAAIPEP
jgi:hypothetical protein